MPLINFKQPSSLKVLTLRVSAETDQEIEEYMKWAGIESKSDALRELVSIGLEGKGVSVDALQRANKVHAEGKALAQLSDALDDALIKFRESREEHNG